MDVGSDLYTALAILETPEAVMSAEALCTRVLFEIRENTFRQETNLLIKMGGESWPPEDFF